jgi:hypothetical protein
VCLGPLYRQRDEVDTLLSQMYTRSKHYGDKDPSTDIGIHTAMLKDDQLPDDVHPRIPTAMKGKVIRLPLFQPKLPQPPVRHCAVSVHA